ncbi:tenascin-N isoform X2 [Anguilla rostrata]|uniref:tenascin-N isoform X2 n=1 Tax=Anguilla rostrata TaxID=7938 RepID=UPI0030D15A83
MLPRPNRRSASLLLGALCALACLAAAADDPPAPAEKGLTFSHVYTIDLAQGSDCKPAGHAVPQDQAGELQGAPATVTVDGENDVVFKHNIRLQAPKCDCEDLEAFRSLLYRINGLEEEVTYLKGQCSQGCCSQGADTACGGHGTYQRATCSCLCDPGWEGPDCSASSCPDECNDNGRCVDGRCQCHAGYGGHDCSQLLCPNDCNDKGHCVDGRCVCFLGFTGEDCGLRSCPNDCAGNGRCADGACVCEDGFSGADCSRVMGPKGLRLLRALEDSLQVEWDPVRGAEYYALTYHPKGNQRALQRVKVPNTQNSYLITGLVPGVTYVVQVHAVIKEISSEANRLVASTVVSSVDGVRVLGQTEDTIQVDWQNPAAELDHFRLTHSSPEGQEEEEEVPRSQEARTKHTIIGLHPGTEYHITVQAIRGAYEGKASSVTGITELDAPTNLVTREVTEDTITVTWDKVHANVDGYVISYTSADGTTREIPVGADSASYRLTGLRPGVAYTISIWAVKGSRTSRKTSTQAETALDAPTNLVTREVTDDTATVTWDKVRADVDGYVISYTSADGSSREIPVGADSASYRLTGLRPGVAYTVYVWAVKGSRASRKTSTQAETEIDAPSNLKASGIQKDAATVTWKSPLASIDGYILTYRAEDGSGQAVERQLRAGEKSFGLAGLDMGKRYVVTLLAYRGAKRSRLVQTTFSTVGLAYPFPMDCTQIMTNGNSESGVYTIYVNNDRSKPIQVYCDMATDGGGWAVLQRRTSGKLDFMKRWRQYVQGFGDLTDEFWLGLEKIYELTNTPTQYELRVDLKQGAESAYAVYDNFKLAPPKQKYRITVGNYRGNAGDAMTYHQGRPFSTVDSDNDIALGNCALTHRGAWWYKNCHLANLNGKWGDVRHSMGVNWEPWKGHLVSLDFTEMKIRPAGAGGPASGRKRRSLADKRRTAPAK